MYTYIYFINLLLSFMFEQVALPYDYDALEPYIDARTMSIHYTKHHAGYTKKLNAAIQGTELEKMSIEELLTNPEQLPEEKRQAIINNWWGYYNHNLFWTSMKKKWWGEATWELWKAIESEFWSFDNFVEEFTQKSLTLFGSWRTYLCKDENKKLCIKRCSFQETPLKSWLTPLLWLDVWEHAYYLHYQNKRADYIKARRNVINWEEIENRYTS